MPSLSPSFVLIAAAWMLGASAGSAHAERADRTKPMVVESDGKQAASVDLAKRTTTVVGNVVISQGTLQIRADRVDIREEAAGHFQAQAQGSAQRPATFRQKRDRLDEVIEAEALRVDYEGGADRVRFSGDAKMRVLRAGVVADEASASAIVYDQPTDTITFEGGAPPSAGAPAGRARLVFVPRNTEPSPVVPPLPLKASPAAGAGDSR